MTTPIEMHRLRFVREAGPGPERGALEGAVEERWRALRAQNPRLHDGPVLALGSFGSERGDAAGTVSVDGYKRLCVQPEVPTGVTQLSVTGLLTALVDGEPSVLFARRSAETRRYGGCWELAPSGGIDPPPERDGARWVEFDGMHVFAQLASEAREELGVTLTDPASARCYGMVRDAAACSADLVVGVEIDADTPVAPASWEYTSVRWVASSALELFVAEITEAGTLVPTVPGALRCAGLLA